MEKGHSSVCNSIRAVILPNFLKKANIIRYVTEELVCFSHYTIVCLFVCFERESDGIAPANLELTVLTRLVLNSQQSSPLPPQSTGIKVM